MASRTELATAALREGWLDVPPRDGGVLAGDAVLGGLTVAALNAPRRQAMKIATAVTATMIVEIALISGVTPNRIFE